jgi:hypothetical protein
MEKNLGIQAERKSIIISNGSQQAIDYLCRLMLDPGDTIIVEGPTYLGALQIFDTYQVNYIVAPLDDCGLDVEHLRATLAAPLPRVLGGVPGALREAWDLSDGSLLAVAAARKGARRLVAATRRQRVAHAFQPTRSTESRNRSASS